MVSIGERVFFLWEELDQWVEVHKVSESRKTPATGDQLSESHEDRSTLW